MNFLLSLFIPISLLASRIVLFSRGRFNHLILITSTFVASSSNATASELLFAWTVAPSIPFGLRLIVPIVFITHYFDLHKS